MAEATSLQQAKHRSSRNWSSQELPFVEPFARSGAKMEKFTLPVQLSAPNSSCGQPTQRWWWRRQRQGTIRTMMMMMMVSRGRQRWIDVSSSGWLPRKICRQLLFLYRLLVHHESVHDIRQKSVKNNVKLAKSYQDYRSFPWSDKHILIHVKRWNQK